MVYHKSMTRSILVTGVNGFVGHHVAIQLQKQGFSVVGVSNQPTVTESLSGIVQNYISCDLTDPKQVASIGLSDISAIINLAGLAQVGASFGQGVLYEKINVGVHTVLYNECLRQNVSPRILAISTGAVYDPAQAMPITEDSKLIPKNFTNEYVISKQLMEESLVEYRKKGLHVVVARPFNHSGPGQLPGFLIPDLGEQIFQALRDKKPLHVGNLATKRDYTDVRDVARAYVELATCDSATLKHATYNVCSGKSVAGSEILRMLAEACSMDGLEVVVDRSKIRENDVMDIYGSSARILQDIGWKPKISVEQMINDYVSWKKSQSKK